MFRILRSVFTMLYSCLNRKKVILDKSVLFNLKTFFEGGNKVSSNSIISGSTIGFGTYIGTNCMLSNSIIGKYCSIGSNINIISATHPTSKFVSTHPSFFSLLKQSGFTYVKEQMFNEHLYNDNNMKSLVVIGNDVWIGNNVTLLGGIEIGDGAIIATGAIITKDVAPYSIVGGVPAKLIRYRFTNLEIDFLNNFKWWNRGNKWIEDNYLLFSNIKEFIKKYKNQGY